MLFQNSSNIDELRHYAEQYNVPIMDKISTEFVKQLIRIKDVKSILEIGTAIGYSSMHFASCDPVLMCGRLKEKKKCMNKLFQILKTLVMKAKLMLSFLMH